MNIKIDKLKLLLLGYKYYKVNITCKNKATLNIVYNIHNSLPETNNGYAIRTHFISKSIQSEGISIFPVTRVGFPIDLNNIGHYLNNDNNPKINDLVYFRLDKVNFRWGNVSTTKYIQNYTKMLLEFSMEKEATLIHSASNYLNGLAGVNCAKILKLPSIYEVRGFWETTRASREPKFKNSLGYKIQKKLEIQACHDATSVIALSDVVKEELIKRGIESKKIFIITNGIDTNKIKPIDKNVNLIDNLDLKDKFIIGFIGSVVDYEGLDLLLKASKIINEKYHNKFRYLIVGDGNDLDNLKLMVHQLKIESLFIFTGRVPYEEVEKYYSIMDVACYPRLDWEVCRIVSPKKPFEAMGYGIPVISSSVRANSYFLEHKVNGLIHEKESVESIVENIIKLYEDEKLYAKIAKNARKWVVENRNSKITGKLMRKIYEETQKKFYGNK